MMAALFIVACRIRMTSLARTAWPTRVNDQSGGMALYRTKNASYCMYFPNQIRKCVVLKRRDNLKSFSPIISKTERL